MKYLETYRLMGLPDRMYYIPDFISDREQHSLIGKILNTPSARWTVLSHRRLQAWPTQLLQGSILPTTDAIPNWLVEPIVSRTIDLGIWNASPHGQPNHCLINEYEPGQGIMPHEDGDVYFPMVATVSLNDGIILDIYEKSDDGRRRVVYRIYQEPGSLLITTDEMYTKYLHGIQEIGTDKDLNSDTVSNWDLLSTETKESIEQNNGLIKRGRKRISLTFRDVKAVRNLAKFLHAK
ncbi:hypothetical protein POJ06DRAFT_285618 [Lipomyces tetrasporus]|uniref:Fe2OG dioxygenase domain-containing protein n=1 Tax=Lipomyces tetrasporus TaxID=54092 RepID=A0AAD7QMS2_9ASCO|nr:uncharacterized protein POJ06DRAFT_285618 [Lipomyces tetrasporus]KAJ8097761.1 hypothetical protein POJ06DRAFT_285618 [Lipomyces tetrasporus]